MPGAVHLDWVQLVDTKDSQRFRPPEELQKLFDAAKIDLHRPAIAHCQSGGRSSVMAFAVELMGGKGVANYHGSWAEWSSDPNTPVVKP